MVRRGWTVYHDVGSQAPDARRIPDARLGTVERRRHDASYIDALFVANIAALFYTLTRVLTPASYRRALELAALIGVPPDQIAASLGAYPSALSLWPPDR